MFSGFFAPLIYPCQVAKINFRGNCFFLSIVGKSLYHLESTYMNHEKKSLLYCDVKSIIDLLLLLLHVNQV